ncbi:hypothetical protein K458DRAFT_415652 [Lentithecium fluviatile CBS 122367]|uniref:Uncharacterized protein n=1 Tax=Lentithecium fluviatile CBS 122367 TaxID=1168545 RepID=A0A6G1JA10_9PLEO|nr:hypothetical protein K458DRAFT_415652 [Lentithecium fluviatile CBS 122367]
MVLRAVAGYRCLARDGSHLPPAQDNAATANRRRQIPSSPVRHSTAAPIAESHPRQHCSIIRRHP